MMTRPGNWSAPLYPLVAKLVRAHRPARSAEEDLCQMIFIKIMQKLSQFSGKAPLEHWVSRIAINTCINQIQAENARPELRLADLSEEQLAVIEKIAARPRNYPRISALPRENLSNILC